MDKVFVYWDNSNIFIGARAEAEEREGAAARYRVRISQLQMLRDFADYNGDPGIVVLLTGDGQGFYDGAGFHADLERMHRRRPPRSSIEAAARCKLLIARPTPAAARRRPARRWRG